MTQLPNTSMTAEVHAHAEIQLEPSPFEEGFKPESLPRISVPDLPKDAQGLSAEALSKVPTLTELVGDGHAEPLAPEYKVPHSVHPVSPEESEHTQAVHDEIQEAAGSEAQDNPAQADLWTEELQVRMGKLTDDIHTLNARLDLLEQPNKTKVDHG